MPKLNMAGFFSAAAGGVLGAAPKANGVAGFCSGFAAGGWPNWKPEAAALVVPNMGVGVSTAPNGLGASALGAGPPKREFVGLADGIAEADGS